MKLTMVERKIKIRDDLRDYAEKKIGKLDRYFQKDTISTVTFREEKGNRQTVEITVNHSGMIFRSEETTSDMFASVDGAISSIERQIRKNKTRLEKRLREGAFDKPYTDPAEYPEESYDIVRRKKFPVESMTVEEAILQMNMLGHLFYMFKDAEQKDKYVVLYKRASGGYGLIEDID